jgi:hypothetical protein
MESVLRCELCNKPFDKGKLFRTRDDIIHND